MDLDTLFQTYTQFGAVLTVAAALVYTFMQVFDSPTREEEPEPELESDAPSDETKGWLDSVLAGLEVVSPAWDRLPFAHAVVWPDGRAGLGPVVRDAIRRRRETLQLTVSDFPSGPGTEAFENGDTVATELPTRARVIFSVQAGRLEREVSCSQFGNVFAEAHRIARAMGAGVVSVEGLSS